jgi:hypothetical protein
MITRSIDHAYTFEGKTYPGVTGILKVLDKSGPLMAWAARQTAEAAVRMLDSGEGENRPEPPLLYLLQTVGPEGVVKALTSRSSWTNDQAKDLGTDVHEIADRINRGEDTGPMAPSVAERVERYRDWLKASGWTVKISEAYLIEPDLGYGGTLDILARDADGRATLADIKTGRGVYRESVLQLAAYGMAKFIQPVGADQVFPMPAVERYVILHVTLDGVREIEIPVGDHDRTAFLACLALSEWSNSQKGRAL